MTGEVLSDKQIRRLIEGGAISNASFDLINPSSLDLRLGVKKWRLLGSILPLPNQTVNDLIENSGIVDDKHFLRSQFYIDKSQPYLFELNESLNLPPGIYARIFNKSGRGRIGTSVRGIVDKNSKFDDLIYC